MRLTVLGVCGGYPAAGRACSGYLVQSGPTTLLVDCGSGVMANLGTVVLFRHATQAGVQAVQRTFGLSQAETQRIMRPHRPHEFFLRCGQESIFGYADPTPMEAVLFESDRSKKAARRRAGRGIVDDEL